MAGPREQGAVVRLVTARAAARTAGLVAATAGDLAAMEVARLLTPARRGNEVAFRWMRRYGHTALTLLGVRVLSALGPGGYLSGRDDRGVGRLFVINHRSALDVFVTVALVEANALSRADLARWPLIGLAAHRVGTVFVDRGNRASGAAAVSAMAEALACGRGVLVFPEGTTFRGDEIHPFRPGAFVAAERAGAHVVPIGLAYATDDACFGDEPLLTHWRRVAGTPAVRVALEIGEALPTGGDAQILRSRAQDAVQSLVRRARAKLTPG